MKWKPVPGWEGLYEVSDQGQVRSVDRVVTRSDGRRLNLRGKELKLLVSSSGHIKVSLCRVSQAQVCVHRLVLEAFVSPCPEGQEACHNNGDPADNRVDNLRWDTHAENMKDINRHGSNNKPQCVHGHEYTEENTYRQPSTGYRSCRTCIELRRSKR